MLCDVHHGHGTCEFQVSVSLWIISYYIRVRVFTFEEIESEKMIGMCTYIIDRSLIRLSMQESNPNHAYHTSLTHFAGIQTMQCTLATYSKRHIKNASIMVQSLIHTDRSLSLFQ